MPFIRSTEIRAALAGTYKNTSKNPNKVNSVHLFYVQKTETNQEYPTGLTVRTITITAKLHQQPCQQLETLRCNDRR